jgi:hypothetical protein
VSDDTSNTQDDTADDGVVLVAPDGGEVTVRSPEAVNNLVYGQGYRLKGDSDPEAAIQAATADPAGESTAAPSTPDVGSTTKAPPKTGGKATPGSTSTPPTT